MLLLNVVVEQISACVRVEKKVCVRERETPLSMLYFDKDYVVCIPTCSLLTFKSCYYSEPV